ncbi:outer membrane protein [Amaricoccus solimangrovi]|uniref:Porin family protein n=1 Tax=Amaricoccus solimangrovi TaxID=2589815 RepID=A0A501WL59_9RHOB|nr:porin family protein [Amaricoccus solimangrovi]TPE49130.1 porin family protein [Amaricoccus solimangrovi]
MKLKHCIAAGASASILLAAQIANAQGTYFKLFGGWSIPQDQDFTLDRDGTGRPSGLDFDSGYGLGAAIGFAYRPNVDIEIEYVYRDADAYLENTRNTDSGSSSSNAVMINALYEFPSSGTMSSLHPYVGAGLGVGDLAYDRDDLEMDSDYNFAYQVIAGVGYDVSLQASLYTEIRYFSITDQTIEGDNDYSFDSGYESVDVLFGYKYNF